MGMYGNIFIYSMRFRCPKHHRQTPPKSKNCVKYDGTILEYNKVVYIFFDRKQLSSKQELDKINYMVNCDTEKAKFSIHKGIIHLALLLGCKKFNISGNDILTKVISISNTLNMPIKLIDASFIEIESQECTYSLGLFYILLTGQSWYNKYKFRSDAYADEVAYNEKIRKLPLIDFVKSATKQYIINSLDALKSRCYIYEHPLSTFIQNRAKKCIDQYGSIRAYMDFETHEIMNVKFLDIGDFLSHFKNVTETTPVDEIIKNIYDDIKASKPTHCNQKFQSLKKLVDCSEHLLKYSRFLTRMPDPVYVSKRKTRKK